MFGWHHFAHKVKRFYSFSQSEIRDLVITAIVLGFILSFKNWGSGNQFVIAVGLSNWLIWTLVSALSLFVHESAHKLIAIHVGFTASYKLWINGIIIALVLCFITRGSLWFLIAGATTCQFMSRQRIGAFRYGMNLWDQAFVFMSGPLANVLLAAFFKILSMGRVGIPAGATSLPFIEALVTFNLIMAIVNLLPLPTLDGLMIFFASRSLYIFSLATLVGYSLLVLVVKTYSLFLTLLIAAVLFFIYYWFFERRWS